ncbi:hypothetical protein FKW77_009024 [Venturia effusa]|uniref:Uncharacterized protein n=1 Tax=Venturia effusa TaxID=50376 RepID=A0A517L1Z4_9PEZI|nr:hypothetical protein FKW77_009024 [Venturia effusa]
MQLNHLALAALLISPALGAVDPKDWNDPKCYDPPDSCKWGVPSSAWAAMENRTNAERGNARVDEGIIAVRLTPTTILPDTTQR